ncbi:hypothetical protein SAMN02745181_2091 [Rubritalea squalenifaciens DSM 18772]|uniref:DoxX-like family protein n=1 Tax=Rubritalea squalenifaciens DSM 18772 TaxID=1123071 RepID=A0A1M6JDN6_9BACT|nr:hypothetical protein [Rubritalea squalenifaciens]SHJ44836.1 hypothetical protein SAMN02745181_2091 [Rubritalea squalenifaciens DSM 18772]
MAICSLLGILGAVHCELYHHCACGHLKHGAARELLPWIADGLGFGGLAGAFVISLGGGFHFSRITTLLCAQLLLMMFYYRNPMSALVAIILIPFFICHLVGIFKLPRPLNAK